MSSATRLSTRWRLACWPALASIGLALTAIGIGATSAAASAAASEAACANIEAPAREEAEQRRGESNDNPTTEEPYSAGLPDCRAYEMVSPLYKQSRDAEIRSGVPIAADGEIAGWVSLGSFSNPENLPEAVKPNAYLSHPGASEWETSSAFAPRRLLDSPFAKSGANYDTSADMRSVHASCGVNPLEKGQRGTSAAYSVACARSEARGVWTSTPDYGTVGANSIAGGVYSGSSADLTRVFIQPAQRLLSSDTVGITNPTVGGRGIYEVAGCCTSSSFLRLVNVDNEGATLVINDNNGKNIPPLAPLLGDFGFEFNGSDYHAVSEDGGTVFFAATPNNAPPSESEVRTIYARVDCGTDTAHSLAPCKKDGNGEWFETVTISNPSAEQCSACNASATRENATFQGASADGSKVFFTTTQQLLSHEAGEGTPNLYEYDFNRPKGEKLVLVSSDEAGADVSGVVRSNPDGSHVYFVAEGMLTEAANGNGEKAKAGQSNLYAYDTVAQTMKFVAGSEFARPIVSGIGLKFSGPGGETTPDGRYLVFSSTTQPPPEDTNTKGCPNSCPAAVYRYDFQTGTLTWVSKAAPEFIPPNEGDGAQMVLPLKPFGAYANTDDYSRMVSENGEYIIFRTNEQLQASDVNEENDVYEWHNGTVSMISDGRDPQGAEIAGMSGSGLDIFFTTHTELVKQDTDVQRDLYDARVGGGFPAPTEPSCSGNACQGEQSPAPSFGLAASSLFTGGRNLAPPTINLPPPKEKPKAKKSTRAQKLAKALKACKRKPKPKRARCKSQARKKYGGQAKRKKAHKAKSGVSAR